jgi:hypothetical protein
MCLWNLFKHDKMGIMGSKTVKNFKNAIDLVVSRDPLGCELINLYYKSNNPEISNYITFLKCNYCYEYCHEDYDTCLNALRYLYKNNLITLTDFRVVFGRFLSLKKKGYLS